MARTLTVPRMSAHQCRLTRQLGGRLQRPPGLSIMWSTALGAGGWKCSWRPWAVAGALGSPSTWLPRRAGGAPNNNGKYVQPLPLLAATPGSTLSPSGTRLTLFLASHSHRAGPSSFPGARLNTMHNQSANDHLRHTLQHPQSRHTLRATLPPFVLPPRWLSAASVPRCSAVRLAAGTMYHLPHSITNRPLIVPATRVPRWRRRVDQIDRAPMLLEHLVCLHLEVKSKGTNKEGITPDGGPGARRAPHAQLANGARCRAAGPARAVTLALS